MIRWGITAGAHDASLTVVKDSNIVFAGHAERYSRVKNDAYLNEALIADALEASDGRVPTVTYWYENTWYKRARQIRAKQYRTAFTKPTPTQQLMNVGVITRDSLDEDAAYDWDTTSLFQIKHHHSHAAAGYYTSPYTDAAVLVVDSIGEFETLTIWQGVDRRLKQVWRQRFPHSIGLWYSAMTQRIGLKPNEDEYILMGMAACGDPERFKDRIYNDFFEPLNPYTPDVRFKQNLHRGCQWWAPELNTIQDYADIAASTQAVYEMVFEHLIRQTKSMVDSPNLVIMGGCALNCVANSIAHKYYDGNVWIMPNPGDAGSSLGAVLAGRKDFINWTGPYLGTNIPGKYPINNALKELTTTGLCGVANGRAEFGPRALGNRSLFADPRGADVKDLVNTVKNRQEFRPFAPVILDQYANDYFDGPVGPYMQYTSVCRRPDLFPAIAHLDNTSRVQTVKQDEHPGLHKLLTEWYRETGCPMILNTSLNVKGEPIVNSIEDAQRWQDKYNVKVFTKDD